MVFDIKRSIVRLWGLPCSSDFPARNCDRGASLVVVDCMCMSCVVHMFTVIEGHICVDISFPSEMEVMRRIRTGLGTSGRRGLPRVLNKRARALVACRPPFPTHHYPGCVSSLSFSSLPTPSSTRPTMSKKGAKPQAPQQTYELRDVVLAKVRGFPAWPGMVSPLSRGRVPQAQDVAEHVSSSSLRSWIPNQFLRTLQRSAPTRRAKLAGIASGSSLLATSAYHLLLIAPTNRVFLMRHSYLLVRS